MIRAIGGLGPKGKTPLGDAVRQAAAALQYTEDPATVVLISDGKENCGMDPCALGTELARTGVDFTALVIGFDVDEIDQAGLRCLAENTGGLFLPAEDATGLREAIDRTVEEVEAPPAPVVEDPGEATLSAPVEVRAGSEFEVSWTGPDSRNDYITLVPRGSDDREYGTYVYTRRGSPIIFRAPDEAGPHELRYVFNHTRAVLARAEITVVPVSASVTPPAEVAAGAEFEVPWEGPNSKGDFITIVPAGTREKQYGGYAYTRDGSPAKLRAPEKAGAYEIRYLSGQGYATLASSPITVR